MKIVILVEDKAKTPGIVEAIDYFQKLCSGWLTTSVTVAKHRTKANRKRSNDPHQAILSILKPTDYFVALDRQGPIETHWAPDSYEFSDFLGEIMRGSWHRLVFAVGGADGLPENVLTRAERILSLSRLTFPHDIVPLMLLEQIYRSLTILHRHPYHR